MAKVGIIICDRYSGCAGGKCLKSLKERAGGFSAYPADEAVELVGYANCGGCPGGNIEYAPAEMIRNGAEVIHFATGFVVGYPPCPHMRDLKEFIESRYGLKVVIGTHPIPLRYYSEHVRLPYWERMGMRALAPLLFGESEDRMRSYD